MLEALPQRSCCGLTGYAALSHSRSRYNHPHLSRPLSALICDEKLNHSTVFTQLLNHALTIGNLFLTIKHMRVVMDADCLIKLTKANLKEVVCTWYHVILPETVKKEVVDNAGGHMDAIAIGGNIAKGLLKVDTRLSPTGKGEQSVVSLYQTYVFDAVCSDDKRFIKKLRLLNIPYITPAVFVALLVHDGKLTASAAESKLNALSPFISSDEYLTVRQAIRSQRLS